MEQQTIKWPKGKRCAFSISFDLDGESPWIHRDAGLAERPLHMSMGAYGPKTAMPRILRLMDRYDLKVGGVDYATSGGFIDDIKDKLDAYKADIISGKIVVPTDPTKA